MNSVIRRRTLRPRSFIDLEKFSQVLKGSANDDLTAKTSYFVFNSLFYGEPVQLFEKRFGIRMRRHSSLLRLDKTVIFFCFCTGRHPELRIQVFHTTLLEGWVPLYPPTPRIVSTGLSHNPVRGMGPFVPTDTPNCEYWSFTQPC